MKKRLLLFILLSVFVVEAQEKILFPDSFKLDPKLLSGLVIAKIPEELQEKGITGNPALTDNKDVIGLLTEFNIEDVFGLYYEVYQSESDKHDDAGVVVSRFVSEEALHHNLGKLRKQSNLSYLVKNNYLIEVWSDVSQNSREQIMGMVDYYQNKLQAELYMLPEYYVDSVSVMTEEEQRESYQSRDSTTLVIEVKEP